MLEILRFHLFTAFINLIKDYQGGLQPLTFTFFGMRKFKEYNIKIIKRIRVTCFIFIYIHYHKKIRYIQFIPKKKKHREGATGDTKCFGVKYILRHPFIVHI